MLIQDHALTAQDFLTASDRAFDETTLFRAACACEQATEWGEWRPLPECDRTVAPGRRNLGCGRYD